MVKNLLRLHRTPEVPFFANPGMCFFAINGTYLTITSKIFFCGLLYPGLTMR